MLTDDWRRSLEILEAVKSLSKPTPKSYTAIIERAIREGDEHIYWKVSDENVNLHDYLRKEVLVSYIDFCEKNANSFTDNINKILTFIGDNGVLISVDVANAFRSAFERFGYNCGITSISRQ